jgi:redox-sensitive bicupin YhaK (pirin superfamily)
MIRKIKNSDMGKSKNQWLDSIFHFSFADYFNIENISFGDLRVINDDLIQPHTGFDTHPHKDMEIISYGIEGELTHEDSMGSKGVIGRGQVQYMSAGTGVYHSEHNRGDVTARFLQIWVLPDKKNHTPQYGDFKFDWELRKNKWFHFVSSKAGDAPIKVNQDINFYALELDEGNEIDFAVGSRRQAYMVQIEGASTVNAVDLDQRDAAEIVEEDVKIKAKEKSHILIIEMTKKSVIWR